MKKIIALLLILLLIPICVHAEEDPIVGVWYMDYEYADVPSLKGYEDQTRSIILMTFESNGDIYICIIEYKDVGCEVIEPETVGSWEKTGDKYKVSLIGVGINDNVYIRDDGVLDGGYFFSDGYNYCLHKMAHFNWYNDLYLRK